MTRISKIAAQERYAEYINFLTNNWSKSERVSGLTSSIPTLDLEWPNIVHAYYLFKAHSIDSVYWAEMASNLVAKIGSYLEFRRHPKEYLIWLETALGAARFIDSRSAQATHLGNIGNCYHYLGDFELALWHYDQSMQLYKDAANVVGQARILSGYGVVHATMAEFHKAIQYFEEGMAIAEAHSDWYLLAKTLLNLGGAYVDSRNPQKATNILERALDLFNQHGDKAGRMQALNNLATAHMLIGDYSSALDELNIAIKDAREFGSKFELAHLLGTMGVVLAKLGKYDHAIDLLRQSLHLSEEIGEMHFVQLTKENIATLTGRSDVLRTA